MQSVPENWIKRKRQLSLSDCYWIKHDVDKTKFDEITPYKNTFISFRTMVRNSSVPAQTLTGTFTKEWVILTDGSRVMRKLEFEEHIESEYASIALANDLQIPCNKAVKENQNTILIYNISNLNWMLITYQQMGMKVNGYSPKGVASIFFDESSEQGALIQILFDAIVSNNDRHNNMGNLAVMKNTDTGECKFPPMFDFNLAHHMQENLYLGEVSRNVHSAGLSAAAIQILKDWGKIPNLYWEKNRLNLIHRFETLIEGKSSVKSRKPVS